MKHGLRARPGGWTLAVGLERERGIPAPPEDMQCIGHSEYGTNFHCAEAVKTQDGFARPGHWLLERRRLNWSVDDLAASIQLLAMSQSNVLAFLKRQAGVPSKDLKFYCPTDPSAFDLPWSTGQGANSFSMRLTVPSHALPAWDRTKLHQLYSSLSVTRRAPAQAPAEASPE